MRRCGLAIVGLVCLSSTLVQAAGVQFILIPADAAGPVMAGAVWSPCAAPAQVVKLHGLAAPGVLDCPIAGDRLPLVVISHGTNGWFGAHHDTAEALADAGFVVAAINHPGDSVLSESRVDPLSIAVTRPTDIKRLVDFMLDAWPDASKIARERSDYPDFAQRSNRGGRIFESTLRICARS